MGMTTPPTKGLWTPEWTTYAGRPLLLPRFGTKRNYSRPTLGPAVFEISKALGTPLMAWQQYEADVALELDPATLLPVYREVWTTVPRQSGKTTLLLSLQTHRCIGMGFTGGRQVVLYSAQTRNDARKKWEDEFVIILEASPFGPLFRVRKTNGNEAILWRNGSMWGITSTTEKSGHGTVLDMGVIDEAFAQDDDRLEQAFKPAMLTRRSAQMHGLSTAGTLKKSKYLKTKVDVGRRLTQRGVQQGFCYFEWSVPTQEEIVASLRQFQAVGIDPSGPREWPVDSPETWHACMPALHWPDCPPACHDHTVTEAAVQSDLVSMRESDEGIDGFRRAYLNQWVAKDRPKPIIQRVAWQGIADQLSQLRPDPRIGMALDCTPERDHAAIGIYGLRPDGLAHVEVAVSREGTAWVVPEVARLVAEHHPLGGIVIDPAGAAGAFIKPLRERGVEVTEVTARELVQATGHFYDMATNSRLRHRDQACLNDALAGARKRNLADAWTWDRRKSSDNIAPLVAVTLALHGFLAGTGGLYDVLSSVL